MRVKSAALFIAVLASVSAAPIWAQFPVAHWTFDNPITRYADVTGNGHTLTPVGTVGFTTGISGDGMDLNNGGKAYHGFGSTLQMNEFSISMWADLQSGSNNAFDDYWEIGVPGAGEGYVLENTGGNDPDAFNVSAGAIVGAPNVSSTTTPDLMGGGFHHLVMTMSAADNDVNLYIDGVLNDSSTWSAINNIGFMTLGGRFNTGVRNIDAILDDVQVYDYALSANQVDFLFNNAGHAIPEPTSIAIWSLLGLALVAFGSGRLRRRK